MRFAHISDCHIGSWNNHPELEKLPNKAFTEAVDICISKNVDFVLIAGDLFNTSIPPIDALSNTTAQLRRLKDAGIPVYVIAGSHDFSPSGKTMLSVLENAGLLKNIATEIEGKTKIKYIETDNAIIAGISGKKGSLEHEDYKKIIIPELPKNKFKIFIFHSAIEEFKPSHLEAMHAVSVSDLPKGFDYYASGHVHVPYNKYIDGAWIVFPGCLFPCNFTELEKNPYGGFYIVNVENDNVNLEYIELKECERELFEVNANGKTAKEVEKELIDTLERRNLENKIVLIKIEGTLEDSSSDINFDKISSACKGALSIKKNLSKLKTKEFEEIEKDFVNIENLEINIIKEHINQSNLYSNEKDMILILDLMKVLEAEKMEDETNEQFLNRIFSNAEKILGIE